MMRNNRHVVILGAGASRAALPRGDKNGMVMPVMNDFWDMLSLCDKFADAGIHPASSNIEDIYLELANRSANEKRCEEAMGWLEDGIKEYLGRITIPDEPTIYDCLLLSLTEKDLIATFNWDPLLVQVISRWEFLGDVLPYVVFLHGNVGIGFCEDDMAIGRYGNNCHKCGRPLSPSNLLYPVKNKNYTKDTAIGISWEDLAAYLEEAYLLTIFGYSAPKSDSEAISLMEKAWSKNHYRDLAQIEVIDIKSKQEITESWAAFIHKEHYACYDNFFKSTMAMYPRRSCECFFDQIMRCRRLDESKRFTEGMTFDELRNTISGLVEAERMAKATYGSLTNPYVI